MKLPVLPLRNVTLFPRATLPVTVGRATSLRALEAAGADQIIATFAQRDAETEDPDGTALCEVGCTAKVLALNPVPHASGTVIALLEGIERVRLLGALSGEAYLAAEVTPVADITPAEDDPEYRALDRNLRELIDEVIQDAPNVPDEVLPLFHNISDPGVLADVVGASLPTLSVEERQSLLGALEVKHRLRLLGETLARVRQEQQLRNKIRSDVEQRLNDRQRDIVLREQMSAIRKELGELDDGERPVLELRGRLDEAKMPETARAEAERELRRLEVIPVASPEHSVIRNYLDWLAALPWTRSSAGAIDAERASRILDRDHYDLAQVKERILEYLAVLQLRPDLKAPILCFVGPPGVGKTSLGRSIAEATGRKFARIPLGGSSDEAEIRGHRRTYIGAMPGQIIQAIRRADSNDPVFMLDEVDKLGRDFRGDPASALLEVLDPEQNHAFRDRFLDVPFDLSRVLFITTANLLDPIPHALRDRMEVIELPGYVDEEKREIARRFLVPQQVARHGIGPAHLRFSDGGLAEIVRNYTREAGVRRLEQQIAAICRKRARSLVRGDTDLLDVDAQAVRRLLGPRQFEAGAELEKRAQRPGVAVALAWTQSGGEILFVEAARMTRDRGEFRITGHVKKVMEESAYAALSWLRAHSRDYGIASETFGLYDLHVHIPSGAAPKDGPSAGIVIAVALLSLFVERPTRPRVAFTGEITLSGRILPVGGIKGKVLAARREGILEIVLPAANRADVEHEIPPHLRDGLRFHYVDTIDEALARAFDRPESVIAAELAAGRAHAPFRYPM